MRFDEPGPFRRRSHVHFGVVEEPILFVEYPAATTREFVAEVFDLFLEVGARWGKVAYVFDMIRFDPTTASPELRALFTETYVKHRAAIEAATLCEARIVRSIPVEQLVSTIDWKVEGRSYVEASFPNRSAAVLWTRQQVQAWRDGEDG